MHWRMTKLIRSLAALLAVLTLSQPALAQLQRTPDARADDAGGPYERLVISGAIIIDGSGAPPVGPRDILIEGNRISAIGGVGSFVAAVISEIENDEFEAVREGLPKRDIAVDGEPVAVTHEHAGVGVGLAGRVPPPSPSTSESTRAARRRSLAKVSTSATPV